MFKYKWIDNNVKNNLILLHGYGSDYRFAQKLFDLKANFNFIVLELPGAKENITNVPLTIELFVDYVKKFLNKRIKGKKNYLLGHSFGGAVSSYFSRHKKIKEIIYLAPLNPSIQDGRMNKILNYIHSEKNQNKVLPKLTKSILSSVIKLKNKQLDKFISDNPWLNLVKNTIVNSDKISEIKNNYETSKKQSLFILGEFDSVIKLKPTLEFVRHLNARYDVIDGAGHNPIKDKPHKVLAILNGEIPLKKRFIIKGIKIKETELII